MKTQLYIRFNSDEIDSALRMSNNDVEKAIQFLTREIVGLDAAAKPAPSVEQPKQNFGIPDILRNPFVDSDEEDIPEDKKTFWDDEAMARIRVILENNHRYVIFRQNGTLHRRMMVSTAK